MIFNDGLTICRVYPSITRQASPYIVHTSWQWSWTDLSHAPHINCRSEPIYPRLIVHLLLPSLHHLSITQHDHVMAIVDQATKNYVLLTHQVHLFQLRPLDSRQHSYQFESSLKDRSLPEVSVLPYIHLLDGLLSEKVTLSALH